MFENIYINVNELLKEKKIGNFELSKFSIDEKNFRAIIDGINPGDYIKLTENDEVVMSDTDMEKRTNLKFCTKAYGDILIGGLGIGLIIMAIQDKEEVKSITIIEKNEEVIELIKEQLPFNNKVNIICADIFEWIPVKKQKFDCIYLDIWSWINQDVYNDEMKPLKQKYRKYLKSKELSEHRFINCWAENEARFGRRLY